MPESKMTCDSYYFACILYFIGYDIYMKPKVPGNPENHRHP